jgi:hypothetical protein
VTNSSNLDEQQSFPVFSLKCHAYNVHIILLWIVNLTGFPLSDTSNHHIAIEYYICSQLISDRIHETSCLFIIKRREGVGNLIAGAMLIDFFEETSFTNTALAL